MTEAIKFRCGVISSISKEYYVQFSALGFETKEEAEKISDEISAFLKAKGYFDMTIRTIQ